MQNKGIDRLIGKANTLFSISLVALWWHNERFQTSQNCQFLYRYLFPSSPVIMDFG